MSSSQQAAAGVLSRGFEVVQALLIPPELYSESGQTTILARLQRCDDGDGFFEARIVALGAAATSGEEAEILGLLRIYGIPRIDSDDAHEVVCGWLQKVCESYLGGMIKMAGAESYAVHVIGPVR